MNHYRFLMGRYHCMIVLDGTRPCPQPSRRFSANVPALELADTRRSYNLDVPTQEVKPHERT